MWELTVDMSLCHQCGNCDFLHPDLIRRPNYLGVKLLRERGLMMISDDNLKKHNALIERALTQCHIEALQLVEVTP